VKLRWAAVSPRIRTISTASAATPSTKGSSSEPGANAHLKIPALVTRMVVGADPIDDVDLQRHGGMGRLFTGI
jgi:hypothetical protein